MQLKRRKLTARLQLTAECIPFRDGVIRMALKPFPRKRKDGTYKLGQNSTPYLVFPDNSACEFNLLFDLAVPLAWTDKTLLTLEEREDLDGAAWDICVSTVYWSARLIRTFFLAKRQRSTGVTTYLSLNPMLLNCPLYLGSHAPLSVPFIAGFPHSGQTLMTFLTSMLIPAGAFLLGALTVLFVNYAFSTATNPAALQATLVSTRNELDQLTYKTRQFDNMCTYLARIYEFIKMQPTLGGGIYQRIQATRELAVAVQATPSLMRDAKVLAELYNTDRYLCALDAAMFDNHDTDSAVYSSVALPGTLDHDIADKAGFTQNRSTQWHAA